MVAFSRVGRGATVMEIGAGTGNFLDLFSEVASHLIAIDVTEEMLQTARAEFPSMSLVMGDGTRLPFRSRSVELVSCAQMLHHVHEPLPLLKEMRRVAADDGRVLVVDQAAPESYEQTAFMNQLEAIRDPSHAASRSPSSLRVLVQTAGMEVVDEKLTTITQTMSKWMAPGEFPAERFAQVERFIERFGDETGMRFRKENDEWAFDRTRVMFLCRR
ncbi:MAG: methyltransferase domain-containing protein [Actinobacteria bacterium]|nr:methyltransferase domain-containing protein [Actinomycetota bacterium]